MLRNSPILLEKCQPIQFINNTTAAATTSIYDSIRKQPDSHCLSTLESCERAIRLLEPSTNPQVQLASYYLLESLRSMILTQMKYERIQLEKHPESIRNMEKLMAKKERQVLLSSFFQDSSISNNSRQHDSINGTSLPSGYTLRPLVEADGTYVNSIWPFRSNKSLIMITKQIVGDIKNATIYGSSSTCLGIEFESRLVGCIIRHRNGSVGILHVDEEHRRFGLGEALLKEATKAVLARGGEDVYAFILDGNHASEALFTKLGWEKVGDSSAKGTGKRRAKRKWMYLSEKARVSVSTEDAFISDRAQPEGATFG
ncbi:hypothetical protein ACHAWU_008033 [Discostella pseudostelligera]|uniref:N-acetyltransferase domain-containing protein n=1 Tax=Discostella pseudostelligera TaxID=259834 RepID=A0ABD3MHZ2_9STRA